MRRLQRFHLVLYFGLTLIDLLKLLTQAGELYIEVDGALVVAVEYGADEATQREGETVALLGTVPCYLFIECGVIDVLPRHYWPGSFLMVEIALL